MPRVPLLSLSFLIVALMAAPAVQAADRTVTVVHEPMSAGYGSCSGGTFGEIVDADLVYHEVVRMVIDDEQMTRYGWVSADAISGYGVGSETGTRYRITYHQTGNIMYLGPDASGPDVLTSVRHIRVVPLGQPTPGSELLMWETVHYTVTSTGEVVADVAHIQYECV